MLATQEFLAGLAQAGLSKASLHQVAARQLVWSRDASHYEITPGSTLRAQSLAEIAKILEVANAKQMPVTFRSGGSSLSGQTLGRGLILDTRSAFQEIVAIGQDQITLQAGVTLARANGHLAKTQRKLGPDPASMVASTIGGAISNNSSGMTCGTKYNSYATIQSAKIVFADGKQLDTAIESADDAFRELKPELHAALARERQWLLSKPELVSQVKRLFALKNTMGYSINALIDHEKPVDILLRLLVGAEGTLAFVGEATLQTLETKAHKSTSLLVFENLEQANSQLVELLSHNPAAIELMDRTSLAALDAGGELPKEIKARLEEQTAVLLVEFEAKSDSELTNNLSGFAKKFGKNAALLDAREPKARNEIWRLRKNLYAIVAKARPAGTTALLEDVAVPPELLAKTCNQLIKICVEYGYGEPVVFGHVRDGNIHFMISDDFTNPERIARFGEFTAAMVEIVLANGGNLKAEHGTGRAMAPYVEAQFGSELYDLIKRIKTAFDPNNILNPGTIIPATATEYLENLKAVPEVDKIVDSCVECGYCESSCPSAGLTLTPRERIVAFRQLESMDPGSKLAVLLRKELDYQADASCATDGMCAVNCPVGINTGDFVKQLRTHGTKALDQQIAVTVAKNWGAITTTGRLGLKAASKLPALAEAASRLARAITPKASFPLWQPHVQSRGAAKRKPQGAAGAEFLYLPSCMNELFGDPALPELLKLSQQSGQGLQIPEGIGNFCCGTPFSSKGYQAAKQASNSKLAKQLSNYPQRKVVIDGSSCHQTLKEELESADYEVLELSQYLATWVLDLVPVNRKHDRLVIHPTCSGTKTASNDFMMLIAGKIAKSVEVPVDAKCCGFAGDRGLLVPELTANATYQEAKEATALNGSYYASNNQPCQIALSGATGKQYRSIFEAWLWSVK